MLLCGHRWNTGARSTETANALRMRTRTGSTKATQGATTGQHRATTSWAIPTERRACRNGEPLGHRRHTAPRGRSRTAGRGTRWAALPAGPCGTGGRSASVARQTAPAAQLRAAPGERRPQLNARESSDTRSYSQALPRGRWACEAPKGPRTSGGCNASGTRGRRSVLRNSAARVVVRPPVRNRPTPLAARFGPAAHPGRGSSNDQGGPARQPAPRGAAPRPLGPHPSEPRGPRRPTRRQEPRRHATPRTSTSSQRPGTKRILSSFSRPTMAAARSPRGLGLLRCAAAAGGRACRGTRPPRAAPGAGQRGAARWLAEGP